MMRHRKVPVPNKKPVKESRKITNGSCKKTSSNSQKKIVQFAVQLITLIHTSHKIEFALHKEKTRKHTKHLKSLLLIKRNVKKFTCH